MLTGREHDSISVIPSKLMILLSKPCYGTCYGSDFETLQNLFTILGLVQKTSRLPLIR